MVYSREFFALQIEFAKAVAALGSLPIDRALLDFTNLYIRFGLGRDFDHSNPIWRHYVDGLTHTSDVFDWTYRFYLAQAEDLRPPPTSACFSYAMQGAECVRIHFRNAECTTTSPLSSERLHVRLGELRSMFDEIKRNGQNMTAVVGTSWLYNLPVYQRCFPVSYVASAKVAEPRYRHVSLWGQFLDRNGSLRHGVVREFQARLSRLTDIGNLPATFPLQALAVEAPITDFYKFYGISTVAVKAR